MKMPKSLYTELKAALMPYHLECYSMQYKAAGLAPMRYRWDMLHYAIHKGALPEFFRRAYAAGLHDSHIDSALSKITGTGTTWPTAKEGN